MNDGTFRRDSRQLSIFSAARVQLQGQDASRAFAPEPPASPPLGQPANVPALGGSGGGEDPSDLAYAQKLIRDYGPTRAIAIAVAEGRKGAADLIQQAVADAVAMAVTVQEAREAGWL
jgi:hypothetical protein